MRSLNILFHRFLGNAIPGNGDIDTVVLLFLEKRVMYFEWNYIRNNAGCQSRAEIGGGKLLRESTRSLITAMTNKLENKTQIMRMSSLTKMCVTNEE